MWHKGDPIPGSTCAVSTIESTQIQFGNKIIEVELSNGSYSGYCVGIEDYEPIVKEVQSLSCANNQLQVAGADVCDDFDPINFDCRNFHSGWDFIVQQTNLNHFSFTDQQTGTTQTLEFEKRLLKILTGSFLVLSAVLTQT